MPKDKARKESGKATLARVKKEMAKSRVVKSARKKYEKATESHFEDKF